MKLKQLEVFVAVADHKSFSRAAEALYLTQPTVSVYISGLEKELNAKLFVRNTKEICMTEQGTQLYQYAREILILQDQIMELFAADSRKAKPRLVVAASTVPSRYLLPDILARYKEKYPYGQLELRESDSARVIADVASHVVDVGFTGTVIENKSCRYLPFYEDEHHLLWFRYREEGQAKLNFCPSNRSLILLVFSIFELFSIFSKSNR